MKNRKLLILGTRGIPAKHGGFETFAERLALYLVERQWDVTVYCQTPTKKLLEKNWKGVNLVEIPVPKNDALSTIIFDFKSTLHAVKKEGIVLLLGYNTAIFSLLYRLRNKTNVINMDGLEWQREKWKPIEKAWLYLNEHFGAYFSNHIIADHPEIKNHIASYIKREKITVISYGAQQVVDADAACLRPYDLLADRYALIVARPEPENSILEIVSAFSKKKRGLKLVVLGNYYPHEYPYHQKVMMAASDEVIFTGGIYKKEAVEALRFYTKLYIHGHTVGGTNPSLVEALAAGTPVLAHDNRFNHWVAGSGAHYFKNQAHCIQKLDQLLWDADELEKMKIASIKRYKQEFSDNKDLKAYEDLLLSQLNQTGNKKNILLLLRQYSLTTEERGLK